MRRIDYTVDFMNIIGDMMEHPKFIKMKSFTHHGHDNSVFDHSMAVAYYSYVIARKMNLDAESTAKGAFLHDFFLYDWRTSDKVGGTMWERFMEMHAFKHPKVALDNAEKYFNINNKEADMIVKHMFPVTIVPPKYAESWVVSIVDKAVAATEMFKSILPVKNKSINVCNYN